MFHVTRSIEKKLVVRKERKNNFSQRKIPAPPPPGYQMVRPLLHAYLNLALHSAVNMSDIALSTALHSAVNMSDIALST